MMAHDNRIRTNRDLVNEVEMAVRQYVDHNRIKDEVTVNTLKKLKDMPSTYYRSEFDIKRAEFLLRGLLHRVIKSPGTMKEYLNLLNKIRFYR